MNEGTIGRKAEIVAVDKGTEQVGRPQSVRDEAGSRPQRMQPMYREGVEDILQGYSAQCRWTDHYDVIEMNCK